MITSHAQKCNARLCDLFSSILLHTQAMTTRIQPGDRYDCKVVPLELLRQKLTFPVAKNVVAKNRLIKAPMIEMLGTFDFNSPAKSGLPTDALLHMNQKFAEGGCGINVTGCIVVSDDDIEGIGNVIVSKKHDCPERKDSLKRLASCVVADSLMIAQIVHPGKRALKLVEDEHIPFDINTATKEAIERFTEQHVYAAEYLYNAGFHGVELNVSLDFGLGQVVSAALNNRKDEFGGSLHNRTRIIFSIIERIRCRINDDSNFVVGMKLPSLNYEPSFDEDEYANYCQMLNEAKLDYVMLAGGHYRSLENFDAEMQESTRKRETFFMRFAQLTQKYLKKPKIIMCGGFVTAEQIHEVLSSGRVDAVAMGRALAAEPDLPRRILSGEVLSGKKTLLPPLDYLKRKDAAGMQLWQLANDLELLDLTDEHHVEAFQQAMAEHYSRPKTIADNVELFGYPKLDVSKI